MPRASRFRLELEEEFKEEFEDGADEFLRDIAERVYDIAVSRTRKRTGRLQRSWAISVGSKPDFRRLGKGALRRVDVKKGLFVHNKDFRATFHEYGTVKMSPRPMLRPGILAVRGMEQ